jgi:hypothetical protein
MDTRARAHTQTHTHTNKYHIIYLTSDSMTCRWEIHWSEIIYYHVELLIYHLFVTSDGFIHYKPMCYVQQTEKASESSWYILPSRISVSGSVLLLDEFSDLHFGTQTGYFKGDFSIFSSLLQDTWQGITLKQATVFCLNIIYKYLLQVILYLPIPLRWHKRIRWSDSPLYVTTHLPQSSVRCKLT